MKTQAIVSAADRTIICIKTAVGSAHDFRVFRESRHFPHERYKILADSGYQGIGHLHGNCLIPTKKPRGRDRSKEDRRHNRELGSKRVVVEHAFRAMKVFRILAAPYRNRRKRFGLRVNLIAAIVNAHLG